MNLIVVESPTKAKTLNKFLGKGYDVVATKGHLKDLPKSKLGVDTENNFDPIFEEVPKQAENIKAIVRAAQKATNIFLATDPDREGEAISAHVKEILQEKSAKVKISDSKIVRISFHEITKSAVDEAIAHPGKVNVHLVDAQIARRVLDRLVGYKLSPLLWKKIRIGLSAGRVQSVAVRLIVEKEREINAFKPVEYWEIGSNVKAQSAKGKSEFFVSLSKVDGKKAEVHDSKTAKNIVSDLEKASYEVIDVKRREVKKRSYAPFTTSTMSQAGARLFGWSAKRTMSTAQKLYEEGAITYHRTDSVNISSQAIDQVRKFIVNDFGDKYLPATPNFYKKQSKMAQEAHEAIRPTKIDLKVIASTDKYAADAQKLYELIWRRFVASQMNDAIFDETTIVVKAGKYELRASGQIVKFEGWKKLFPKKLDEEAVIILPEVKQGEELNLIKVLSTQKFTEPPARFNEASLIKTLEKLGIGRPSTYAPTISTIQARGYIEKDEGKFTPTSVGIAVNDFLIKNFPNVFEYGFTAEMEGNLDRVAEGKLEWHKEIKTFWKPFEKKLEDVTKNAERVKIATESTGRECPDCKKGELVIRQGRFGKFISCSTFPDCKYTEKIVNKINMKCPTCKDGEVVLKKTKKGRKFFGCSRYPECDYASWKDPRRETGDIPKKVSDKAKGTSVEI